MANPLLLNVNALTLKSMVSLFERRAKNLEEGLIKASFIALAEFAELLMAYNTTKEPNYYLELTQKVASLKRCLQDDSEARQITNNLQNLLYAKERDLKAIEGKYKELCNRVLEIEDKYVGFRKRTSLEDLQIIFEKTAERTEKKEKRNFYNLFSYFLKDLNLLYKTEEFSEKWIKIYKNLKRYCEILLKYFESNKMYIYTDMTKNLKRVCDQQTSPEVIEEEIRKLIRRLLKDKLMILKV